KATSACFRCTCGLDFSEGDGTRTRNHRIDSVVPGVAASPASTITSCFKSLPRRTLPHGAVLHRVALVLYGMVQHRGTYEAPDPSPPLLPCWPSSLGCVTSSRP